MREKTGDLQLDLFEGEKFKYRCILTNDRESSEKEVIESLYAYVCLKNKQAGETCVPMSPDYPFDAFSAL
jgi:hypothetical protein